MKKIALLLACVSVLCACGTGVSVETTEADTTTVEPTEEVTTAQQIPELKPLQIHSIAQLNTTEYPLDSAAGEEKNSTLVSNYRESYTLDPAKMGGIKAYYTRIKKIDDSNYIMIFHNTRYSDDCFQAEKDKCKGSKRQS